MGLIKKYQLTKSYTLLLGVLLIALINKTESRASKFNFFV